MVLQEVFTVTLSDHFFEVLLKESKCKPKNMLLFISKYNEMSFVLLCDISDKTEVKISFLKRQFTPKSKIYIFLLRVVLLYLSLLVTLYIKVLVINVS